MVGLLERRWEWCPSWQDGPVLPSRLRQTARAVV
jgi:hypothetical protein